MKKLFIFAVALILSASAFAQKAPFKQAVGGKIGYGVGAEYQYYLSGKNFIDAGISYDWDNSMFVNAFYNWCWDIKQVKGLSWYVGPGAYIGGHFGGITVPDLNKPIYSNSGYFGISVNAQIGIQYVFDNMPLVLSCEWAPGIDVRLGSDMYSPVGFAWRGVGIGAKYIF